MSGSARSRNNTLLCLMAVYGIHGVLFHVLSSPPVLVTSVIVEPACLRTIIIKSRLISDTNFYNQSFPAVNKTKNNVSAHLGAHLLETYHTNIIGKNVDDLIRNKTDSSTNEVSLKENRLLEKREISYSVDELLDSTSLITASGTLSAMPFFSLDSRVLKILSPSAWGVFIGCLVFLFTSTDCEIKFSSR
ncbi:uncharacterized protein LOC117172102 [Belonocnema kinseyi]|uniref:uncharacterized protein LOC117172102 n=1 Tax=Belonocnema kinseyi TaxID=2817044 RepID=UPI00143DCA7E|nr:uncharacterized protein LOC117172102 [Belonocnema kinseyi]XP_033215771.1 uncharacterized protein LOC117172102 [Belonocnema kinseyi]